MNDTDGNNPVPRTGPAGPVAQGHGDLDTLFEKISELPPEYVDMVRALVEFMDNAYEEAHKIVEGLSRKDRSLLAFYTHELADITETVQIVNANKDYGRS